MTPAAAKPNRRPEPRGAGAPSRSPPRPLIPPPRPVPPSSIGPSTSSGRGRWANAHVLAVVVENKVERALVARLEDGAGQIDLPDLVAVEVDGEDGGDGLAGVGVDQERGQQVAGEGGVDLLERLAIEPHRGADAWLLGRGQQGGDAGVGIEQPSGVSEPVLRRVGRLEVVAEGELDVELAPGGDDLDLKGESRLLDGQRPSEPVGA